VGGEVASSPLKKPRKMGEAALEKRIQNIRRGGGVGEKGEISAVVLMERVGFERAFRRGRKRGL